MAHFPSIKMSEKVCWGPSADIVPEQFRDIPYAPFSKSDRLYKMADWYQPTESVDSQGKFGGKRRGGTFSNEDYAGPTQFSYKHAADEEGAFSRSNAPAVTSSSSSGKRTITAAALSAAQQSSNTIVALTRPKEGGHTGSRHGQDRR